MQELSDLQRQLILARMPDDMFGKMPEDWVLALDSKPVEEWPREMIEFLKDSLPSQDD